MGKHNRKSKKKLLKESLRLPALAIKNNVSRRNALYILDRFSTYCYDNGIRDKTEIDVDFINEYSKYLQSEKYSASTIHTYLVFVCKSCGVKLDLIDKPMRRTSEYTKGRVAKEEARSDMDPDNPRWEKVWEISRATGLRREELRKLRVGDFKIQDGFDSYDQIFVKRGKGGRSGTFNIVYENEIQREKVREYFDLFSGSLGKTPDDYVFDSEDFKHSLNLHKNRRDAAKRSYYHYLERCNKEPGYREKLLEECKQKYRESKGLPSDAKVPDKFYNGRYYLRGKNREYALKNNMPLSYDKLCVFAVSLNVLAHSRCDVSIVSYIGVL